MKPITITFAVVLLSLATFVVCDEFSDFELACIKEKGVTEDALNKFFHGGLKPADANDNLKCFVHCVMEKEGYMKGGMFLEEPTVKSFKEDNLPNVEKVVADCKNEKGANDCDTAFKIMMCWANNKINLHE